MNDPIFDLTNRVVVVTGGLGQLGSRYANSLAQRGARVAVLDVTADAPAVERAFGPGPHDDRFLFLKADVTSRSSLEEALAAISRSWGVPHGLINNAALDSPPGSPAEENGPFETYPESSFDQVMEVNSKGVFLCCQVFGGAMADAGRGSIVNIASIYGTVSPQQDIYEYRRMRGETFYKPVAYSVSKSSLYNLTRYLSTYWGRKGVRVNTLTLAGIFNHQDEEFLKEYCRRMPIGRMANVDEYCGAVVFLLSDASSYMTGSDLVIDGGWTAW